MTVAIKWFHHFNCSAELVATLKEMFEFVDMKYPTCCAMSKNIVWVCFLQIPDWPTPGQLCAATSCQWDWMGRKERLAQFLKIPWSNTLRSGSMSPKLDICTFSSISISRKKKTNKKKTGNKLLAPDHNCICPSNGRHFDMDELYNESCLLKEVLPHLESHNYPAGKLWAQALKSRFAFPQYVKLLSFVLSIPLSNTYSKQVFSIMKGHFSIEFWLSRILPFVVTQSNVLEATPTTAMWPCSLPTFLARILPIAIWSPYSTLLTWILRIRSICVTQCEFKEQYMCRR